jgi:cell wall-associated NlpC family hydrolase
MLVSPIVGISIIAGASGGETGAAAVAIAACNTSGPLHGLTNIQARNARVIVAAAQQYLIDDAQPPAAQARAELIALMAADVESTLHDYANPNVPASEDLPNDGDPPGGGDHDSVGLFQQRANWGPLSSRMNPVRSTRRFLARVVETSAWSTQPPGIVAQAVQGSAYPDRYAARQSAAQAVLAQIETSPELALCGSDGLPLSKTGSVPAGAIPAGYTIPRSATDAERRAITFALAQLGKPYVYGATGPDDYDCSGLVLAAWAAADVSLPHYTLAQYKLGTPVPSVGLMSPGDLIFIPGSDGTLFPPNPQHVGMYLGHGYVIEAPQTGDVVKIVPTDDFGPIVGIRHYG